MSSKARSQKEGSGTPSRAESKSRAPPGPLGLPPFTAFEPDSPKWGEAEAGERRSQDGGWNKARTPACGGPKVSRAPLRHPDLKANDE